jgi:hypothetical protein
MNPCAISPLHFGHFINSVLMTDLRQGNYNNAFPMIAEVGKDGFIHCFGSTSVLSVISRPHVGHRADSVIR